MCIFPSIRLRSGSALPFRSEPPALTPGSGRISPASHGFTPPWWRALEHQQLPCSGHGRYVVTNGVVCCRGLGLFGHRLGHKLKPLKLCDWSRKVPVLGSVSSLQKARVRPPKGTHLGKQLGVHQVLQVSSRCRYALLETLACPPTPFV